MRRKEKQQRILHQTGFSPTSRSAGKSQDTAPLESELGEGLRQHTGSVGETSKIAVPLYSPGRKTDSK